MSSAPSNHTPVDKLAVNEDVIHGHGHDLPLAADRHAAEAETRTMTRGKLAAYVATLVLVLASIILAASLRPYT